MSFVCTQFKCQTVLFDPQIGSYQVLPLQARVDLGAMVMKGYSTFPKASALQLPPHQIILGHIQDTCLEGRRVLFLCRDSVGVFSRPSQLDSYILFYEQAAYEKGTKTVKVLCGLYILILRQRTETNEAHFYHSKNRERDQDGFSCDHEVSHGHAPSHPREIQENGFESYKVTNPLLPF